MRKKRKIKITYDRLVQALDYNPQTGEFRWKERPSAKSRRRPGDLAGGYKMPGVVGAYLYIAIDGVSYMGTTLAWLYVHKTLPPCRLAFVNGNSKDLRISNLCETLSLSGLYDHDTPEGRRAYGVEHRKRFRDHYKNKQLQNDFGITLAEYNRKLEEQGHRCAICKEPEREVRKGAVRAMAVDHHHDTGMVRDLLCTSCNKMIGLAREDERILLEAITYLRRHSIKAVAKEAA